MVIEVSAILVERMICDKTKRFLLSYTVIKIISFAYYKREDFRREIKSVIIIEEYNLIITKHIIHNSSYP
jgi:hypothetical protein